MPVDYPTESVHGDVKRPHVVIEGSSNATLRVLVDGHLVIGITALSFTARPEDAFPSLVLELLPSSIALDVRALDLLVAAGAQFSTPQHAGNTRIGLDAIERVAAPADDAPSAASERVSSAIPRRQTPGVSDVGALASLYLTINPEVRRSLCVELGLFTKEEYVRAMRNEETDGVLFDALVIARARQHQCVMRLADLLPQIAAYARELDDARDDDGAIDDEGAIAIERRNELRTFAHALVRHAEDHDTSNEARAALNKLESIDTRDTDNTDNTRDTREMPDTPLVDGAR